MRRTSDLAVSVIGLLTSVAIALLLHAIERRFGIALYGWTVWFVVPAGALCAGVVAGCGYYAGARLLHARPSRILLINILLGSTATFFVIHYLAYASAVVDDRPVSELVSFGTFMDAEIRNASMTFYHRGIRAAQTGAVGHWGYGLAALQVLGFAAGGFAIWSHLAQQQYCRRCERYLSKRGSIRRYAASADVFSPALADVAVLVAKDDQQAAIELVRMLGSSSEDNNGAHPVALDVIVTACTNCRLNHIKVAMLTCPGSRWEEVPEGRVTGFTEKQLQV